ncbi:bifunctional 3-oxoadipate enol-lactonase/4-carboxymuconolactone decarboxylase PcaDC [Streptomyces meridianus]|uniref:3-oxoadipate enol-lactonase n=1 Tax=Streptomyces meridianus TaxID=2938945 RepID=A0ABT0X4G7_9ACTN|nr:3-oxoadipate enol-lactonase [Streptomyces meridianus]MCM2577433.1 3-oxoadipate enol-lactonase [Streptomyces meridianus]
MSRRTPRLHYRVDGPDNAPPLVLGPSLGTSLAVWEPQAAALSRQFRVIRWDLPGHGRTPADVLGRPEPGAATVGTLAGLVLELADALGADRFAYAGISLGGAVGSRLALDHPGRVTSLALVCSSARFGAPASWHERAALVRSQGTEALTKSAAGRWFTPGFAADPRARALLDDLRRTDPQGYAACCDALAAFDVRDELPGLTAPLLVVAGREDPATPPSHAREIADAVPGAALTEVAGAAHLAGVERPAAVLAALRTHLDPGDSRREAEQPVPPAGDDARRAAGTAVRREVLGDDHVDRSIARSTAFTGAFQDFITRYAWGEIWTRPGLSRKTRSCITLTALVARGHHDELAMHVRAALRNGLTTDEIQEVLLQSAVYCGVPAANAAFAVAQRVLKEDEASEGR